MKFLITGYHYKGEREKEKVRPRYKERRCIFNCSFGKGLAIGQEIVLEFQGITNRQLGKDFTGLISTILTSESALDKKAGSGSEGSEA
jgi:hypothetical protein